MKLSDWIMLLALSLLWGGSFIFNKLALQGLPVLSIVAFRVVLAALILWAAVYLAGLRAPRSARVWRWFLSMGLLNNALPFSLIVWGQTEVTVGLASILNATTPLFIVGIAFFMPSEIITKGKVTGMLIGFLGVVVMLGSGAFLDIGRNVIGQLAILCAAVSYACASIYGRRFHAAGIPPVVAAAGHVTMSALILLPVALIVDGPADLVGADISAWMSVVGLAVLSTAVAYVLYFRILASAGSINLTLVTFLMPVTAILLGMVLFGESVRPIEIVGMAIISLALIVIDGRLLRGMSRS